MSDYYAEAKDWSVVIQNVDSSSMVENLSTRFEVFTILTLPLSGVLQACHELIPHLPLHSRRQNTIILT